ncbi:molybdate ABC transporter substrate-binding protein [Candidatus Acetothermia bacterium]|nr:molybdate ABC transporter substrate-binding protein [Candidatus Acetothermia bacterium]
MVACLVCLGSFAQLEHQQACSSSSSISISSSLARQIENGAPFDLFAAADVTTVDGLVQKGLIISESKRLYARGRLILWWPTDSKVQIDKLQDLLKPEMKRIALANPQLAPYGEAAKEALIALGLWDALQPKLVFGENVSAAKQFATTGNAEVAFIPISLAQPGKDRFLNVSGRLHRPLDQALGIVKASKNQTTAQRFIDFLAGDLGHAILEDFWYSIPCSEKK